MALQSKGIALEEPPNGPSFHMHTEGLGGMNPTKLKCDKNNFFNQLGKPQSSHSPENKLIMQTNTPFYDHP